MTPLDRAIHAIIQVLDSERIEYAIVGGIANAVWGEPRATIDVDVTVAVDDHALPATIATSTSRFRSAVADATAFVRQTRVLLLDTADGVRIDVIFALLPFGLEAIRRARKVVLAGRTVAVVTPEDLVLRNRRLLRTSSRGLANGMSVSSRSRCRVLLIELLTLVMEKRGMRACSPRGTTRL